MFKKGDKVVALRNIDNKVAKGTIGIVYNSGSPPDVKWTSFLSGNGWGIDNMVWCVDEKDIELYQEPKSESLKPEDLLIGEYYTIKKDSYTHILRCNKIATDDKISFDYCISITHKSFYKETAYYIHGTKVTIEKASKEEIEWLTACIMLGKYVSKEEIAKSKEVVQEKPEVLVFGKFKIGSIVVSLNKSLPHREEGTLLKINPSSDLHILWYTGLDGRGVNKSNSSCFRQANEAEIKAFESGITNIKDMKTEEDLVGRYIKALKDFPEGGPVKKDELGKITRINGINAYVDFPSQGGYYATFGSTSLYELMPIGFTPNEVKEEYSFYVKYEPDFTEDIFNKFKDWALSKGKTWNFYYDGNLEAFKYGGYLFYDTYHAGASNHEWGVKKQLSLSELCDLIGYKQEQPINTNTMELTGDWCIKVTDSNRHIVKPTLLSLYNPSKWTVSSDNYYGIKDGKLTAQPDTFGKELTLDEFKKLVLKEQVMSKEEEFKVGEIAIAQGYKFKEITVDIEVPLLDNHLKYPLVPEECITFAEPKKEKYKFSEVEYLAKPINQQLDLPIVKKYKKKSIINL